MTDIRKFWMVRGQERGMPTVEHDSEEIAVAEAERLAKQNPDTVFYVLEAMRAVIKSDVRHVDLTDLYAGQIPF